MIFNNVDQEIIKVTNRRRIIGLLYEKDKLTKQQISSELGISIPTVTHNVTTLIKQGFVRDCGVAQSTGGRKPVVIEFLANSRYTFGVEIQSDEVKLILTNLKSEIIEKSCISINENNDMDSVMSKIKNEVYGMLDDKGISVDKVLGIGFALHGTVDEENMMLKLAPNLALRNVDFSIYKELFNLPIYTENEANVSALAEVRLGMAKGMRNLVYISINEGVGTGIVIRNHLYKGKNSRAGEFGHMTVNIDGELCNCGKKGCWELYSSSKAIMRNYNADLIDKTKISTLKDFFDRYLVGEPKAIQIMEQYIDYLAIGIQNIILTLDPQYIVIGGELSDYAEHFIIKVEDRLFNKESFYANEDNKIFVSRLKTDAATLGASLLPIQELLFVEQSIL